METYDYEALPVKHIRHRITISRDGLKQLANNRLIATHWVDIRSRDPEEYRARLNDNKGKSAVDDIKEFNDIDETGAIVVADYSSDIDNRKGIHKSKLFAGVVPPGSFEYRELPKVDGSTGIYKTLQFDETTYQEILLTERPDLFSDVPARGTINNCNKTEGRLRSLVNPEKSVSRNGPEHLSHEQFEHVCVQYLSLIEFPGEFYTTTPVGGADGNLPLIDINGGVGETSVVAQVTTATGKGDVEDKLADMAEEFSGGTQAYFFGPQRYADEFNGRYDAVTYVGDSDVFDALESNPETKQLINRVLRR